MNKKHIVTSIGVVLLTTGVIGGIWSGIDAMPIVINNAQMAEEKYNKEEVIYKSELKLTKLNIESNISNVIINKYNGKDVVVERSGNKELSNITTEANNNELVIKEERNNSRKSTKSVDDIVKYVVGEMYSPHYSEITVYVPENLDLNVKTNNGMLYVNEGIELNNVDFSTQYGGISFAKESKVKNLNIKSESGITLQVGEIYCAENVNIEASNVYINEDNYTSKGAKIPENVKISVPNDHYESNNVSINSKSPIAKNLVIDSNATVELELPLLDYKFNFDIKTSRGIGFDDYNYEKYMGTVLEKYFKYNPEEDNYDSDEEGYKQKELVGLMNEELKDEATGYNINIKSGMVIFN